MTSTPSIEAEVASALAWLKRHSSTATRAGMARYAIPSDKALGVSMKDIKALGRELAPNHALAAALWDAGVYEARPGRLGRTLGALGGNRCVAGAHQSAGDQAPEGVTALYNRPR